MLTRRRANAVILSAGMAAAVQSPAPGETSRALPPPRQDGGKPLMEALKLRRSTRVYSSHLLSPQIISDLLWAAFGINRPSGDRTAPYWRHIMVIDIYAAMADGVWLYDPKAHALVPHSKDDLRALSGTQDFVGVAPLNLVYVAHGERMTDVSPEERRLFASADACFIGQNVYLFCASQGLATVFRGSANQARLGAAMGLPEGQFVTFAQTVGYPAAWAGIRWDNASPLAGDGGPRRKARQPTALPRRYPRPGHLAQGESEKSAGAGWRRTCMRATRARREASESRRSS